MAFLFAVYLPNTDSFCQQLLRWPSLWLTVGCQPWAPLLFSCHRPVLFAHPVSSSDESQALSLVLDVPQVPGSWLMLVIGYLTPPQFIQCLRVHYSCLDFPGQWPFPTLVLPEEPGPLPFSLFHTLCPISPLSPRILTVSLELVFSDVPQLYQRPFDDKLDHAALLNLFTTSLSCALQMLNNCLVNTQKMMGNNRQVTIAILIGRGKQ